MWFILKYYLYFYNIKYNNINNNTNIIFVLKTITHNNKPEKETDVIYHYKGIHISIAKIKKWSMLIY